ncbi:PTS IIA-like nitrogen-regulatory protein PtsN [Raoultella ornithinolytica]|nr:PTS IIA-like nitrogen-regulatory protein PtsN [Raoultella ornithinolytica]
MDEKLFAACQYTERGLDWRGAIKLACRPLAQQGENQRRLCGCHHQRHREKWPLVHTHCGICPPARRPDEGVLSPHSVLSLVCCAEAVAFPDHPDVRLIIVLAAADSEQHIQTIQRLVCWLDEGDRLHRLTRVEHQSQLDALVAGGK